MPPPVSREAEDRGEARAKYGGVEGDVVVVEAFALGNEDMGGEARGCAAPGETICCRPARPGSLAGLQKGGRFRAGRDAEPAPVESEGEAR